jgi:hypothetical protein
MVRFLLAAAAFLGSLTFAQIDIDRDHMPQAPKGLPPPQTADGHIDFSGVYHAPGYGPGDPPIRNGETIARNIARDLTPADVPLLDSGRELMRQRNATNSKDDPEGLCLPMGTPRKDPCPTQAFSDPL